MKTWCLGTIAVSNSTEYMKFTSESVANKIIRNIKAPVTPRGAISTQKLLFTLTVKSSTESTFSLLLNGNQHSPRPTGKKRLIWYLLSLRFKKETVDFWTTRFLYLQIHILILFSLEELHFRTILPYQYYQSKGGQNRVLFRKVNDGSDKYEIQSSPISFSLMKY